MGTSATAPVNPVVIEDETIVHELADGMIVSVVMFKSGKTRMQMNAVNDMIAMISRTSACWTMISAGAGLQRL
jgi:hypothetical protein